MYPDFGATIIRRPDMYFVGAPLMMGAMLVVGFIANLFGLPHRERIVPSIVALVCLFGAMAAVAAITGILPQGKIEIVNDRLSASMRFRRTRVFDLRQTTITLEQWLGPGSVRGGPMGPMLVFDQGDTHFRVGCYDYEGARLLTPVDVGEWRTREAHGATKCKDFYALADLLGVQIPRPPGWRLTEVF
jgi:hypothetical protein